LAAKKKQFIKKYTHIYMTTPVHYSLLGHCYSSFHSDSLLNPNDQGEYVKFS